MKKVLSVWSKPTIISLSNTVVQGGSTFAAAFETIVGCNGPVTAGTSANPGPGNDPDCTGSVTYTVGGSGTGVAAFGSCFGACS